MQRRDRLYNNLEKAENFIWELLYTSRLLYDMDFKKTLAINQKYKDKFKGKRCFILGNGPSLNKQGNLELLENEIVFSVNQFYRSDLFKLVKPNFHLMVDPLFFSLNEKDSTDYDTLKRMQELKNNNNLVCIFPYTAKDFVENYKINNENTLYIHSRYRMHDNYKKSIRMDRSLPLIQNVVHGAIYCAIYMGFTEIYLMGVDMTNILTSYIKEETELNIEKEHVYTYTENEKKRMLRVRNSNDNETMLKLHGIIFSVFRNIYEYCDQRNIKIYNATISGGLDNIPRIKYEDVVLNNRNMNGGTL
ncbi:hypothetical protein CN378_12575 [Bacillus sp. AFS015802]|uniref:6-hydroxymethylpterin diphosphokinase MptE-like protein n=1 Tax=Bacillus sp. AFS015802 TaxID=2033486 RepID=UPI000BF6DB21|nr:6-hydroxymethylpterin diphosphokinase MptE-like protein [Bacillus sp. AFS015802]PFA66938.1 hypothetical protein CN378_12575 [Bacillus sp. AFS015802]